jgi:hypothetical protein
MVISVRIYDFLGKDGTAPVVDQENSNPWRENGGHILFFCEPDRIIAQWNPPKVEVLTRAHGRRNGKRLRLDDIRAGYGGALIANKKAKEVIEGAFGEFLEFLPLDCPTEELWVMHVLPSVQSIDHARSCPLYADYDMHDVPFKPIGPRVGTKPPYAFFEENIKDLPVFRDVDAAKGFFMTDRFVDFVQASGLTGFEPKLRYDSKLHAKGFDERGQPIV